MLSNKPPRTQYEIYGDKCYTYFADGVIEYQNMNKRERIISEEQFLFFFLNRSAAFDQPMIDLAWEQVTQEFSYVNFIPNSKLGLNFIGCQYWVSVLLTNCFLCICGLSKGPNKFEVDILSAEKYLASVDQLNEENKFD